MINSIKSTTPEGHEDFLSLDIGVGDSLQLQDSTAEKHRYHVKLIGYLNKASLVVSQPHIDGHLALVAEGSEFFVRGFSDAKTYEFNAKVLSICNEPYPYMHLSFPESVSVLVMRGAMRIKVKLPCSALATTGGMKMPAMFNDLSTSGASIQSSVKLGERGETIQLNFRVPVEHDEQALMVSAIIRNVDEPQEDGVINYGVQFVSVTTRLRIALQTFIYTTLIEKQ